MFVETEHGDETTVSLAVDIDTLRDEIASTGARLVVLDALLSTFGSAKLTEQGTVRRYLEPLAQLAQDLNIAVVGVAHFRKASDPNPLHMIAGSAEFGQVVRSAIGFAADREAEDGSCVLSLVKTNIAPAGLPSVRYRIESATVDTSDGPTDVGRFVPLGDTEQTVGELLNHDTGTPEDRSERTEASEWLRGYLTDNGGEAPAGDVIKAAEKDGFAKHTVQRARRKAGVKSQKSGFGKGWVWALTESAETPEDDTKNTKVTTHQPLSPSSSSASPSATCIACREPMRLDDGSGYHPMCDPEAAS
nr:AAA family ATPase [Actinopolyspora biskrensis]